MALTFRTIPTLAGHVASSPLGLNNRGWAPVTLFLAGMVATALAFACTATYARKERVTGYLAPREGVTRMAAPRPGILTELFVQNGDLVKEGDPLFTIDTKHALAAGSTLSASVTQGLRRQISLLDEQIGAEQARTRSEGERLSTRIQGLSAELPSLDMQRSLQVDRAAVTEARLKALSELRMKGFVSEAEYRAREEAWLGQRQALAAIDQRVTALSADLTQARIERDRVPVESTDRLSRLAASQAELRQRLTEAEAQEGQLIRASRTGRVTSLQATLGQRLDPTKPVLTLLPDGATLRAELYVPSHAIGFIKPGQRVRLMYDTFPYQHFGTYSGVVENVSQTMMTPQEAITPIQLSGPAYWASVRLDQETANANGSALSLKADMTVHADIIMEDRTILEWVLYLVRLNREFP